MRRTGMVNEEWKSWRRMLLASIVETQRTTIIKPNLGAASICIPNSTSHYSIPHFIFLQSADIKISAPRVLLRTHSLELLINARQRVRLGVLRLEWQHNANLKRFHHRYVFVGARPQKGCPSTSEMQTSRFLCVTCAPSELHARELCNPTFAAIYSVHTF